MKRESSTNFWLATMKQFGSTRSLPPHIAIEPTSGVEGQVMQVRKMAMRIIGRYYEKTRNLKVAQILAQMWFDESESIDAREVADESFHRIADSSAGKGGQLHNRDSTN